MRGSVIAQRGQSIQIAYENSLRDVSGQTVPVDKAVLDFCYSPTDDSRAFVFTEHSVKVAINQHFLDCDPALYNSSTVRQVRWSHASPECLILLMKRGAVILFHTASMQAIDEFPVPGCLSCASGDTASLWGRFGVCVSTTARKLLFLTPFVGPEVTLTKDELNLLKTTPKDTTINVDECGYVTEEIEAELPQQILFTALEWVKETVFAAAADGDLYALDFSRAPSFMESTVTFSPGCTRVFSCAKFSRFMLSDSVVFAVDGDSVYRIEKEMVKCAKTVPGVCGVAGDVFISEDGNIHRPGDNDQEAKKRELEEYVERLAKRGNELREREARLAERYKQLKARIEKHKTKDTENLLEQVEDLAKRFRDKFLRAHSNTRTVEPARPRTRWLSSSQEVFKVSLDKIQKL